jgi:superfamily II DNA or RNA helicase
MPTGAGKTQVFTYITAAMSQRGRRVTILVHRRELIAQASRKLTQAGVTHGIIAAGTPPTNAPIQVASVQTLVRRLEETPAPDLIIIDEAHHAAAGSWGKILDHWPDALRLGVTATPARLDGRGLRDNFDVIVHGPTVSDLTAGGYLAPSKLYAPPQVADLSTIPTRAGDFASDATAAAMDKPSITGDAIDHYQRICPGAPAIAFCCTTDHAENVAAQFRYAGFSSQAILGTTTIAQRDQQLKDLASGAIQILTSVDVISEGTDVPAVTAAILLRPTASLGLYLQQVGRILRPAPGKTHAIVLDHVGNIHRHGWPDDVRTWSLDSKPRRQRDNTPAPTVRTCPVCFAAFKPAPICPCCGAPSVLTPREIQQRDGELQELERRTQRRQQGTARSLKELIHIGQQRGMKNPIGWAKHVFYARGLK